MGKKKCHSCVVTCLKTSFLSSDRAKNRLWTDAKNKKKANLNAIFRRFFYNRPPFIFYLIDFVPANGVG
jgi:hypothetical protein